MTNYVHHLELDYDSGKCSYTRHHAAVPVQAQHTTCQTELQSVHQYVVKQYESTPVLCRLYRSWRDRRPHARRWPRPCRYCINYHANFPHVHLPFPVPFLSKSLLLHSLTAVKINVTPIFHVFAISSFFTVMYNFVIDINDWGAISATRVYVGVGLVIRTSQDVYSNKSI